MPKRAVINKNGVFIAKPGLSVDGGAANLNFSPAGSNQAIFATGTVSMSTWSDSSDTRSRYYKRGIFPFGTTFSVPPIAYCNAVRQNISNRREPACFMFLGFKSAVNLTGREPQLWWETSTTDLRIYSWWTDCFTASFVVCYNEAD